MAKTDTTAPPTGTPTLPTLDPTQVLDALKRLDPETVQAALKMAGLVPTTAGLTAEQIQTIAMTSGAANARAMQLALRRENPNYPEQSVFHPRGLFTDDGIAQAPKAKFSRPTFFNGVRLGGELETEEEIELCNRFTETREVVSKGWTATIERVGNKDRLLITVPSRTIDDRMVLPGSFTLILQELLGGSEAVNPLSLQKQIDDLTKRLAGLTGEAAVGAA